MPLTKDRAATSASPVTSHPRIYQANSGFENNIPKRLFMYWHQGWNNAPDIVKRCAATWQKHNSDLGHQPSGCGDHQGENRTSTRSEDVEIAASSTFRRNKIMPVKKVWWCLGRCYTLVCTTVG